MHNTRSVNLAGIMLVACAVGVQATPVVVSVGLGANPSGSPTDSGSEDSLGSHTGLAGLDGSDGGDGDGALSSLLSGIIHDSSTTTSPPAAPTSGTGADDGLGGDGSETGLSARDYPLFATIVLGGHTIVVPTQSETFPGLFPSDGSDGSIDDDGSSDDRGIGGLLGGGEDDPDGLQASGLFAHKSYPVTASITIGSATIIIPHPTQTASTTATDTSPDSSSATPSTDSASVAPTDSSSAASPSAIDDGGDNYNGDDTFSDSASGPSPVATRAVFARLSPAPYHHVHHPHIRQIITDTDAGSDTFTPIVAGTDSGSDTLIPVPSSTDSESDIPTATNSDSTSLDSSVETIRTVTSTTTVTTTARSTVTTTATSTVTQSEPEPTFSTLGRRYTKWA
ncbi:hypothetical protein C8Q76DRAFT_760253 [Earliella scabrosa]|nr:hypothetical protein C8Q76DRAFT_760253 [Earliella scabrosa]